MQPMPFPIPALFNIAVKDICAINTFEKLFHILLSEVYCSHFGFTTLLLSATTTDMSLYEVLNLFSRWPLVFRSFLPAPLVARDVVTPWEIGSRRALHQGWKWASNQHSQGSEARSNDWSYWPKRKNLIQCKFLLELAPLCFPPVGNITLRKDLPVKFTCSISAWLRPFFQEVRNKRNLW